MIGGHLTEDDDDTAVQWGPDLVWPGEADVLRTVLSTDTEDGTPSWMHTQQSRVHMLTPGHVWECPPQQQTGSPNGYLVKWSVRYLRNETLHSNRIEQNKLHSTGRDEFHKY